MSDKWRQRNAHPLHLSVAGSSSIQGDLRGGRHGAGAAGGARRWQCDDWVVVELSAAEFGAQQVRRIIGAVVAAARGSSSEQGAGASLEKHFGGDALPPLAPVEPLWLHSLTLVDGTSLTASEQLDGEVPAQRTDAETAIEHAVIRTAQTPIDEFVRALDADVSLSGCADAAMAIWETVSQWRTANGQSSWTGGVAGDDEREELDWEVSDYELEGEEDDQPDEMTVDSGEGGPADAADGEPPDGEDGSGDESEGQDGS
ncbi:hypothetical protein EMIHUDRAFT_125316, partial [Emiliania huxleyi CCMP1516]|uniref:Uncharacterized protein n=2 Tax=Emiliania huxleyi TaxID=2903 RepID=A0A0D3I1A6_EMIH1